MALSRQKTRKLNRLYLAQAILIISDLFWFNFSIALATGIIWLYFGEIARFLPASEIGVRIASQFVLSILCVTWFWIWRRQYSNRVTFWFELREILIALTFFAIIDLSISAFSKLHFSRYLWVLTWLAIFTFLPLSRFTLKKILIKTGLLKTGCIIIGAGPNAVEAYQALKSEKGLGLIFLFFYDPSKKHIEKKHLSGLRISSNERLIWRLTDPRQTHFVIALESEEEALREQWIQKLSLSHCRNVTVIPATRGIPLTNTDISYLFRHELIMLMIHTNLTKISSRFIKRIFDIVCSIVISILLSPLLIFLTLLIMRDGGKPFYAHYRIGHNGKVFKCLKFRSMATNSDELLEQILAKDPDARLEWEQDFKLRNDPRITRIGHILRKTSLDELPQLFNVLKGDMSLVGPRPIVEEELERYGDNKYYYLMAKPGMTGLWQVSGRNDVDYSTRVYFDAWYVKNWSLWSDIAILFKTITVLINKDGAY